MRYKITGKVETLFVSLIILQLVSVGYIYNKYLPIFISLIIVLFLLFAFFFIAVIITDETGIKEGLWWSKSGRLIIEGKKKNVIFIPWEEIEEITTRGMLFKWDIKITGIVRRDAKGPMDAIEVWEGMENYQGFVREVVKRAPQAKIDELTKKIVDGTYKPFALYTPFALKVWITGFVLMFIGLFIVYFINRF